MRFGGRQDNKASNVAMTGGPICSSEAARRTVSIKVKRSGFALSADNTSVVHALIGAEAWLKFMSFHGKPRMFAQTKGRAVCLFKAKSYQPTESVALTDGEKLLNLSMLSNRLGSPRVTLGGSFVSCGCLCAPLLLRC